MPGNNSDSHAETALPAEQYTVPPVSRAISVLRYIAAGNNCRNISVASKALSINRTTMLRLINTLREERWIEEIAPGAGYRLGPDLISLAAAGINERDIVNVARPILAKLSEALGLSSHLGMLDKRDVIYLVRESPNAHLVSNVRVGTRLPAHATTMGRVLLSQLTRDEIEKLYADEELIAYSENTPATLDALVLQLKIEREQDVVRNVNTFEKGIGSCACGVHDHTGKTVAAINVIGPDSYFRSGKSQQQKIEKALQAAAAEISKGLGYQSR
ncbi:IclR family transcriptional regulator [Ochrobactrum sp. GPK 3]|uniref:IclR family transcriptional regulator n=1 Tax=Brucella sp. 22210 TaxID=3453892 RepID=UPI0031384DE1